MTPLAWDPPAPDSLEPDHRLLLGACRLAYRMHFLGDTTVGLAELRADLTTALIASMGDTFFEEWRVAVVRNHAAEKQYRGNMPDA